jgi:hypothetical protein
VTVVERVPEDPELDEPQVLFREARRRRRRRWLRVGVVVVVAGLVGTAVVAITSSTGIRRARVRLPRSLPQAVGVPTGEVQSLKSAGPLAVNATGSLFVVDDTRHEVLVRLTSGQFRVVAGDGTGGFSGDGGPATKAELSAVTDLAFGPQGDLYLADNGRVRVVDQQGIIETVVGDGGAARPVVSGTPARSASLGPQLSIALRPDGELYLATPTQILLLTSHGPLQPLTAVGKTVSTANVGTQTAPLHSFGQIAVDSQGNVYASSIDLGWSVYEVAPDGAATYLGAARGSGGALADVQLGPGDTAYAGDGGTVVGAEGGQLVPFHTFNRDSGSSVDPERQFFYLKWFAFAPSGALYADNIGGSAFGPYQEILSFDQGRATSLWRHRIGH